MSLLRVGSALVTALLTALALTGCGGGDDAPSSAPSGSGSVSPSPSPSSSTPAATSPAPPDPTAYLPVPEGVALTAEGTALTLGQQATLAWQPRQDTVGVLALSVDRLEQTTVAGSFSGWKIPAETKTSTPYFVRATVTNAGATDLSGRAVPLYAADSAGALIEPTTFASTFRPCRDGVFPAAFAPGASAQVCLVYFVPAGATLASVSFRPTQEFVPITWTGDAVAVAGSGGKGTNEVQPSASPTP